MKKADTRTDNEKAAQNKKENEARIKKMKEMYSMFIQMEREEKNARESNPATVPLEEADPEVLARGGEDQLSY